MLHENVLTYTCPCNWCWNPEVMWANSFLPSALAVGSSDAKTVPPKVYDYFMKLNRHCASQHHWKETLRWPVLKHSRGASRYKIYWVYCHAESNTVSPVMIECKMVKLFMSSERQSRCERSIVTFVHGAMLHAHLIVPSQGEVWPW